MCGIAGAIDLKGSLDQDALIRCGRIMSDRLLHRGPDGSGIWADAGAGVCLAHRRLSIIDLSEEGSQPMFSADGRFVLVFNGEIYNHRDLRTELVSMGLGFRGGSDTEVMLGAISHWGLRKAVDAFTGMFAFALWDRRDGVLSLVRDRLGEKPLYYGFTGNTFLFASELKAMEAHPEWRGGISRGSAALFLKYGYIPAPHSIYTNVRKLLPGTILTFKVSDPRPHRRAEDLVPDAYWSVKDAALKGTTHPFRGSPEEAVSRLESLLVQSISRQMLADVPVGAFLSGGTDSSLVVAMMQKMSRRPVNTFTIGFTDAAYDEAGYARGVARHLGTNHTEMYVTPQEAMSVISQLPDLYDEPFADFSQIPTALVSRMTRKHVTVSLSGDGGDELFFGYHRYQKAIWLQKRLGLLPAAARRAAAKAIRMLPAALLEGGIKSALPRILARGHAKGVNNVMEKISSALAADTPEKLYARFVSHWNNPSAVVLGSGEPLSAYGGTGIWDSLSKMEDCMMALDQMAYLPDDILAKVDRAGMGVSLETRIPLLDHGIVEFAWSLPMSVKYRGGKQKWILRELLHRHIPKALVERPKMGFGIPMGAMLRGELRDWAENLLNPRRLREEGYFDPLPILSKWKEHLAGTHNWQYHLWNVLTFQAWLERRNGTGN